jgi:hypothetical protein
MRSNTLIKLKQAGMNRKTGESLKYLDWIPVTRGEGHRLARGLETILDYLGEGTDYDTIMGDSGQAFIMQGEENSVNLINGAVDVGWWPLHPLAFIHLDFLEKTVGRELLDVYPVVFGQEDISGYYEQWFKPMVESSIAENRPLLAWIVSSWFVITGYDDGKPPLIGECSVEGDVKISRILDGWPYTLLVPGEPVELIDRKEADLEALRYAIALHHDEVLGIDVRYLGNYQLRDAERFSKYWRTGLKAFTAWVECLRDADHPGPFYYHSNVLNYLYICRSSAIRYLETMKERHPQDVGNYLGGAVERYKEVLELIEPFEWNAEIMSSAKGRQTLINRINAIVDLESQSADALEKVVKLLD